MFSAQMERLVEMVSQTFNWNRNANKVVPKTSLELASFWEKEVEKLMASLEQNMVLAKGAIAQLDTASARCLHNTLFDNVQFQESDVDVLMPTESEVNEEDNAKVDDPRHLGPNTDILLPAKSEEFHEFDTNFDYSVEKPDYALKITDVRKLIQRETELKGQEFRLPGFDFSAQLKCHVKKDQFHLSIAFLDPEKDGKAIETRMNTKFIVILKRKSMSCDGYINRIFSRYFSFNIERVYGKFYPFFTFPYTDYIRNEMCAIEDSILAHLHVKNCFFPTDLFLENRVLHWKIEPNSVRKMLATHSISGEKEFGLTSFFYVDNSDGLRVQVRLFINDITFSAEVRYLNETGGNCSYPKINFTVFFPTPLSREMTFYFQPIADYDCPKGQAELPAKSSYVFQFATLDDLLPYIYDHDLSYFFIRIEM